MSLQNIYSTLITPLHGRTRQKKFLIKGRRSSKSSGICSAIQQSGVKGPHCRFLEDAHPREVRLSALSILWHGRKIISSEALNSNKLWTDKTRGCSSSSPWASQDRTGCKKHALQSWRMVLPGLSGKMYLGRPEDDLWGSGVRDTKNPRPVTSKVKKRSWQPMKRFKQLPKWLALKHSFFWNPDYQCWAGCTKGKCPSHIMPCELLMQCASTQQHTSPGRHLGLTEPTATA